MQGLIWLIDKEKNLAMSCLPKNGSQSLRGFFQTSSVTNEEVLAIPTRIVWLRNTKERLISNYSYHKELNRLGHHHDGPPPESTESWESFIDYIFETDDPHWGCQVDQVTLDGVYLGTITHRMEDWNTLWGNYMRGLIPYTNGCTHEIVHNYRQYEINEKYKKDIELWFGLQ